MSDLGYLIVSSVWALLISPASPGPDVSDDKARRLLDRALTLIENKRFEDAAAQLVHALAASPGDSHAMNARLRCLRVLALHEAKRTCDAREDLRLAQQERTKLDHLPGVVSDCFAQMDAARRAMQACSEPPPPRQRCREGMAYIPGGEYSRKRIKGFCLDIYEFTVEDFARYVSQLESGQHPKKGLRRSKADVQALKSSLSTVHWERINQPDARDEKARYDQNCTWPVRDKLSSHPINCISVVEAEAVCHALGKRLPSRLEWKWAARGGKSARTYPGTFSQPSPVTVHMATSPEDIYKRTQQVGLLAPSEFGLYDLAGNVAEWSACEASDLSCSASGGHFRNYDEQHFRVAFEDSGNMRDTRSDVTGFRCAARAYSEAPRP